MTVTLQEPRRPSNGPVTLTLLPSNFRTFHTSWLERGFRVACHGQIGNELVAVVVQGEQLLLLQGHRRMHISGLARTELQRMLEAPSASAYVTVPVVLSPCEDTSPAPHPVAQSLREPDSLPVQPAAPTEDGGQRFINRTAVSIKPRRLLVIPPRADAVAPASAPAQDRPRQTFRRPAEPGPR
jgi:hypothetical protein